MQVRRQRRGVRLVLIDVPLCLVEPALRVQRSRDMTDQVEVQQAVVTHRIECRGPLPRVSLCRRQIAEDELREAGRDSALRQRPLRAETPEALLGPGDGCARLSAAARVGVQHAERLEHVGFRPWVASGVPQQFLGARDAVVYRDRQQVEGHRQPMRGPHPCPAMAGALRAVDGAVKRRVAAGHVAEPHPQFSRVRQRLGEPGKIRCSIQNDCG